VEVGRGEFRFVGRVWDFDTNGNFVSAVNFLPGNPFSIQSLENSFHQDLNSDGVIGFNPPAIEAIGGTDLVQIGANYIFSGKMQALLPLRQCA